MNFPGIQQILLARILQQLMQRMGGGMGGGLGSLPGQSGGNQAGGGFFGQPLVGGNVGVPPQLGPPSLPGAGWADGMVGGNQAGQIPGAPSPLQLGGTRTQLQLPRLPMNFGGAAPGATAAPTGSKPYGTFNQLDATQARRPSPLAPRSPLGF